MADNPFAKYAAPEPAPIEATDNPFGQYADSPPTARITVRPSDAIPFEGPEQPEMGALPAFGVGAIQGATANFGDELAGLRGAGRVFDDEQPYGRALNEANPFRTITGAARLGAEWLTGGQEKGPGTTAYEQARDRWRATVGQAERQHPVASTAGQITGAVAVPVPGMALARGAGMGAQALRGSAVGAGMGGLFGVGEGTDAADRALRGATGTVLGGTIGAVAPSAADAVVSAVRRGSEPLRRGFNRTFNPEREAGRRVMATMQADRVNDPNAAARMTAHEWNNTPGSRLIDIGGNQTRRELDRATQLSPEGDTVVRNVLRERAEGETDRFIQWARHTFHFPNSRATEAALQRESRGIVGPRYRQAYADGDRPLISPELEAILGSPQVGQAMARAAQKGKSVAIAEGHGAFNPAVTVTPDGRVVFNKGPTGVPAFPNLQLWDYTKRELDDMIAKLVREGSTNEVRVLSQLRARMRDELDSLVPSYRAARDSAMEFFGARNASEAGRNFFGSGTAYGSLDEAREAVARMNPLQRQLFQDAYVDRFIHDLSTARDRGRLHQVWRDIGENRLAREELDLALTPARRAELEAMTRGAMLRDLSREAVTGNSQTARRIADWSTGVAAGGSATGFAAGAYTGSPETTGISLIVGALAGGRRFNDRRVAERVARLLMSDNPQAAQHAARLIAQNGRIMNRLRDATSTAATRALPPQTTNVLGPQAGQAARPESGPVPGPPQQ